MLCEKSAFQSLGSQLRTETLTNVSTSRVVDLQMGGPHGHCFEEHR